MTLDPASELVELVIRGKGPTVKPGPKPTKNGLESASKGLESAAGGLESAAGGLESTGEGLESTDGARQWAGTGLQSTPSGPRAQNHRLSPLPAGRLSESATADVLLVVAPPHKRKPRFPGPFFMRHGVRSRQMSNTEVEELFCAAGRLHFDRTPCPAFSIQNDLDGELAARISRRDKAPESMDRMVVLPSLGQLESAFRLSHADAWIRARHIRSFTASAHVFCGLFIGTATASIPARRAFHPDVPAMPGDPLAWLLTKVNLTLVTSPGRRQQHPQLPEPALTETIGNHRRHRDHRSTATAQTHVFSHRIDFVRPGHLPSRTTAAPISAKTTPRNRPFLRMLHCMDVRQAMSSRPRRIPAPCRAHDLPKPVTAVAQPRATRVVPRELPPVPYRYGPNVRTDRGPGLDSTAPGPDSTAGRRSAIPRPDSTAGVPESPADSAPKTFAPHPPSRLQARRLLTWALPAFFGPQSASPCLDAPNHPLCATHVARTAAQLQPFSALPNSAASATVAAGRHGLSSVARPPE